MSNSVAKQASLNKRASDVASRFYELVHGLEGYDQEQQTVQELAPELAATMETYNQPPQTIQAMFDREEKLYEINATIEAQITAIPLADEATMKQAEDLHLELIKYITLYFDKAMEFG